MSFLDGSYISQTALQLNTSVGLPVVSAASVAFFSLITSTTTYY